MSCWIPDPRIGLGWPHVSVYESLVTSAIPFRRARSVRWEVDDAEDLDYMGFQDELDIPLDIEFSSLIADSLQGSRAVAEEILSSGSGYSVQSHLSQGCWLVLSHELNPATWNCCRVIAEALLTMPMPTNE